MSSATNSNTPGPKRARFSANAATTTTHSKSPSEAARECAALAVASLPESTKQLAEYWCTKINTAYAKWYRHHKTMTAHEADPEFIPRSARVNFALTGSRLVTEHDDFKALAASAKAHIDNLQKKLKKIIADAAKLENSALEMELATVIATAVISFAIISLMSFTGKQPTSDDLNYFVYEAFTKTVKNQLTIMNAARRSALYMELTSSPFLESDFLSGVTATEFLDPFLDQCHRLFVAPMKAYADTDKANAVSAIIDQYTKTVINGSATTARGTSGGVNFT